jgi:hypothetical protein
MLTLTIAFDAVGTVADRFNIFSRAFNGVARRQKQYRTANGENRQNPFHSLSPAAMRSAREGPT